MRERNKEINFASGLVMVFLSVVALLAVLSGYTQPPQKDEGAAAHIFQLSIVGVAPTILVFLTTSDWSKAWRCMRTLAIAVAALVLAFVLLYFLEH